jgi:hypothetical protein
MPSGERLPEQRRFGRRLSLRHRGAQIPSNYRLARRYPGHFRRPLRLHASERLLGLARLSDVRADRNDRSWGPSTHRLVLDWAS